jgi:heavy metal sensor kinase
MSSKIGAKFYRRTDVKVTLWYVLTFLVSALVICGFLYYRLQSQLIREVDRFLLDEAKELSGGLSRDLNDEAVLRESERSLTARTYYPIFFRILDMEGTPIYTSKTFMEINYASDARVLANIKKGEIGRENIHAPGKDRPFRIVSSPSYSEGKMTRIIQMGTDLYLVRKSLSNFRENILAALPIILVLGALGGWWLARRSLSPIGYIASKTHRITDKNLGERLTPRGTGDELDVLIQTINEMIARMESSFKRVAEFTADASHELKTPICAMRGEAEVLLLKGRNAEEYQEGLAHFIEQFDRMNQMINDLILLSKVDSSQEKLDPVPLRLDILIRDLCNFFQVLAEQNKISLQLGEIPEVTVAGDKTRLQQLFTNLIDNAIKYTPNGTIRIEVTREGDFVQTRIIDTGIGIPGEEQESIFKRFYRVDKSRSKETGGTGLGLSIAEWIVKSHHGRIEVYSELNKGSTFTVCLPISAA